MRHLQQSLDELGTGGRVIATDIHLTSPAMHLCDDHVVVPPYRDPGCLDFLLTFVRERRIGLIVPTIDTELAFYAKNAHAFAAAGARINVSSLETIEIGGDKQKTHDWLTKFGFPTVRQVPLENFRAPMEGMAFPLLVKPRFGSSSIGITKANDPHHIDSRRAEQNLIVQTIASGKEYTTDVFIDRGGKCRCAVPRRRIETRGGEVSKGVTIRQPAVITLAKQIAEALPGGYGVLNVQIFYDEKTEALAVIEINPRFGGGYPLAHEAGAHMTRWVLEDVFDLPSTATDDNWRDGLVMLRFDEAVFVTREQAGV
jgi:carbamoyl-phosphate synthase large subunit